MCDAERAEQLHGVGSMYNQQRGSWEGRCHHETHAPFKQHQASCDDSTTAGTSPGWSDFGQEAASESWPSTPPRSPRHAAARPAASPRGAELSSKSLFSTFRVSGSAPNADAWRSTVCSSLDPGGKRTDASALPESEDAEASGGMLKPRSAAKEFLRKGSRNPRSLPPKQSASNRTAALMAPRKELRLRPREAFVDAAAAVTGGHCASATISSPQKEFEELEREANLGFFLPDPSTMSQPRLTASGHLLEQERNPADVVPAVSSRASSQHAKGKPHRCGSGENTRLDRLHDEKLERCSGAKDKADQELRDLNKEIERFHGETAALKRLQEESLLAEQELALEREQLRAEVTAEKKTMKAELDAERASLRKARQKFDEDTHQCRLEAAAERLSMREKVDTLQEELLAKEKEHQKTVQKLQRQVDELLRINKSLEVQVARSSKPTSSASNKEELEEPKQKITQSPLWRSRSRPESTDTCKSLSGRRVIHDVVFREASGAIDDFLDLLSGGSNPSTQCRRWARAGKRAKSTDDSTSQAKTRDSHARAQLQHMQVESSFLMSKQLARMDDATDAQSTGSVPIQPLPANNVFHVDEGVKTAEPSPQMGFATPEKERMLPNGLRKVIRADGSTAIHFQNGDIKESLNDGSVVYRYCTTQAVQTTYQNGTNEYRFATGQVERHFADGSKRIEYPNATVKSVSADGCEEVFFPDGRTRRSPPTTEHKMSME